MREARDRAAQIVDQAGKRSNEIVEEAKGTASSEAQRLVAQAHDEVARETTRARAA
jgi:F-type H+-transporting ATPase subunit b